MLQTQIRMKVVSVECAGPGGSKGLLDLSIGESQSLIDRKHIAWERMKDANDLVANTYILKFTM